MALPSQPKTFKDAYGLITGEDTLVLDDTAKLTADQSDDADAHKIMVDGLAARPNKKTSIPNPADPNSIIVLTLNDDGKSFAHETIDFGDVPLPGVDAAGGAAGSGTTTGTGAGANPPGTSTPAQGGGTATGNGGATASGTGTADPNAPAGAAVSQGG